MKSFWQFFRLIFVIFSLYLMGDAFYRWDGFRYYGTFSEFLLSVALASVLWSIVAVLVTILIWLLFNVFEWFCQRIGWKMRIEHLLVFTGIFILLGVLAWKGKRLILPYAQTLFQLKLVVFLCVVLIAVFLTWLLRDRLERWIGVVQERITPLVWLFGIFVIFSVPLVVYHTWFKETDRAVSQKHHSSLIKDKDSILREKNRPNIILVTFDAMTARNMSAYGYHRKTTPFISEWAKTASVFTKAYADSNYTSPTTASLMTGKRVWTHLRSSRMRGFEPLKAEIESLPLELRNNGYYNIVFMVNIISTVNNLGMSGSFDVAPFPTDFWVGNNLAVRINKVLTKLFIDKFKIYNWFFQDDFTPAKLIDFLSKDIDETPYPPNKAFNKLLTTIDHVEKPFFAWVHLNPPHSPYLPPKPFQGMFDQSEEMKTLRSQLKGRQRIGDYLASHQEFLPEINTLRARYDEFVRYCDKEFEDFIVKLGERNLLDNTIVILSSDHGEIFEHNSILHGTTLYEPETNIPLIIKIQNQSDGLIIDDLVEQIDIPATILDLADIPVPLWMEGRSLVPLMRGEKLPSSPVFSMNLEKNQSGAQIDKGVIAVWEGDYKLIHYLEENKSLLFNLKKDPDELNNLIDKKQEIGQHLLKLIKDNLEKANKRITTGE